MSTGVAAPEQLAARSGAWCPYVGLVPFSRSTAQFFFGREDDSQIVCANLVASRLTLLYARSGVGKTSVLRAGVLPLLSEVSAGDEDFGIRSAAVAYVSDWRDDPLNSVMAEIRRAMTEAGNSIAHEEESPSLAHWLQETLELSRARMIYLIFDQFEDYYLYHGEDDTLTDEIGDILSDPDLKVHVLLSVREDALAGLDRFEGRVPHLFENYVRLSYLSPEGARSAIEGPLQRYNDLVGPDKRMSVEPELVDAILDQVRTGRVTVGRDETFSDELEEGNHTAIETPYLQLVLTRLWDEEQARGSGVLRKSTLVDLGGAQTIVQRHLDDVMADLTPAQSEAAVEVFRHLVTRAGSKVALADEDVADRSDLPLDRARDLLERLSSGPRRILRPIPPPVDVDGPPRYEIFHDVMGTAILEWRRRRLAEQQEQAAAREIDEARAAERDTRRRLRRTRLVALAVSLLLVVTCVLGFLTYRSYQSAELARNLAWSRQLAAEADRLDATSPDTAILLGLESVSLARGQQPTPPSGLMRGLARITHASRLLPGAGQVYATAYSPQGTILATAGSDPAVRLWNSVTGHPQGPPLVGHTDAVWGVAFSPDGRLLATASSDRTVRLWNVSTGQPRGEPLTNSASALAGVAFSPDGRLLATAGEDAAVHLWDVATGQPYGPPLTGHTDSVWDVAFDPGGALVASAGADQTVRLWNVATGQPSGQPLTHSDRVHAVAFSPDGGLLATAGRDGTLMLWNPTTGQPQGEPSTGHTGSVWSVAFSHNGALLATTGEDATVRLWDAATGQPRGQPIIGHSNTVWSLAFSPDDASLATASSDQTTRVWTVAETPSLSQLLTSHTDRVNGVAYHPGGALLATAGDDGTVQVLDLASGQPHGPPLAHTGAVSSVAFSPDGALLATAGADATVRLWDAVTGQPRGQPLVGHTDVVRSVAFSPDGTLLATGGDDATARLWEVATGQPRGQPFAHPYGVSSVTFSPAGTLLATASNEQTVRLWDVTTGWLSPPALIGHTGAVWSMAFSPDGRLLATASSDKTIRLWDVTTRRPHGRPLTGHTSTVSSVAFSPDGSVLASASSDATVRLWDVVTGQQRGHPLIGHTGPAWAVQFSPDGQNLATGGDDRTARLWDWQFSSWVATGCALVNRNLSLSEWEQSAGDLPYERTCPDLPPGQDAPPDAPAAQYEA